MKNIILFVFAFITLTTLSAQEGSEIRLSGIVLQLDSIKPVPYTNVYIIHSKKGVIADHMGLFSIEVNKNDTIVFSAVGNRTTYFVVPDTLTANTYSIIQKLPKDTVTLKMVEINSWPSLKQFNAAFSNERGFDNEYVIAQENSNPMVNQIDYSKDVNMKNYMGMHGDTYTSVYQNAHIPLNDVLNPARWDKLVKDWKSGKH